MHYHALKGSWIIIEAFKPAYVLKTSNFSRAARPTLTLFSAFSRSSRYKMNEGNSLYSSYVALCVFNACSAYTAVVLNIMAIYAIAKTSSLPKPLKTLLLSLAVSDFGVGLLVQPLHIAFLVNPSTLTVARIVAPLFVNASFFSVVAISIDRFLAVHLHLRYQELVTHKRVVAVVISIWLFSAIFPFINAFQISREVLQKLDVVMAVIFGLCFACTAIAYCKIYITVRRHRNLIQALQVQREEQNGEMVNDARQRKSAVGAFYVYLAFLVCSLPEYCASAVERISGPSPALSGLLLYLGTLVLANSSLNPVIYCCKMRSIRRTVMDVLRNKFSRRNWTKLRKISPPTVLGRDFKFLVILKSL